MRFGDCAAGVSLPSSIFHLASPCIVDQVHDPQNELLDPTIKGTMNVLAASKEEGERGRAAQARHGGGRWPKRDRVREVARGRAGWRAEAMGERREGM
ncbi:hypothetical protein Fmac_004614 [Flemingia macrophylla]|uniref:Uncharacterized protein n=1 Tax=Flemingia macrophylla TaxID=520843 RepID=A0ABD1N5F6_9FABA